MPSSKGIILTLGWNREACKATPRPQAVEVVPTSSEDLVYIGLVSYIPHDTVFGRVKDIMHCHGDLHCSEICTKMTWYHGERGEHKATNLGTERRQLVGAKLPQIVGTLYRIKQRIALLLVCTVWHSRVEVSAGK